MQCYSLHSQNSVNLLSTVRVLILIYSSNVKHTHTHTQRLKMKHTTKSITQKAGKTYNEAFFCLQGHPSNSRNSFNPEVQFNVSSSTNKSIQVPNKSPKTGFRMHTRQAAGKLGGVVSTTKAAIFCFKYLLEDNKLLYPKNETLTQQKMKLITCTRRSFSRAWICNLPTTSFISGTNLSLKTSPDCAFHWNS